MPFPISEIDDELGILRYRSHDVINLANEQSFESVLYLLVEGELPSVSEERNLVERIETLHNQFSNFLITVNDTIDQQPSTLVAPRLVREFAKENGLSLFDSLLSFLCCICILVGKKYSQNAFSPPLDLNKPLSLCKRLLSELEIEPSSRETSFFESTMILHMEDPNNPSLDALVKTYQSDGRPFPALKQALLEHRKPLHHGAGARALKMLFELSDVSDLEQGLLRRIESGKKIFGLGHRIYKTIDPRATYLNDLLKQRCAETGKQWIYQLVRKVAQIGPQILQELKGVTVHPNVDLYNAAFYYTYGLPPRANTDMFAASRAAGWISHLLDLSQKV